MIRSVKDGVRYIIARIRSVFRVRKLIIRLETGPRGLWMRSERWPLRPWERFLSWVDVSEVHVEMRDCFTMHVLSLQFLTCDGKWFLADEMMQGWRELVASLPRRFPGFDLGAYQRVNDLWPAQGSALCWRRAG